MNNVKIIKMPKKFEASYVLEDSLDRILYTINFKQFELITNETSLKNIFTNEPIETPFSYRINELSLYDSSKLFSIIITHQNIPCEIEVNLIFKENTLDKNTLLTLEIRLIEKFLEQRTDHLYQTESTIIKVEKVKLFDFLISFKIFEPLFDVIVPDKNNIKKGSKIYFNCKKKNIIIENTVTKICIEPNKKKWYLNFVSKSDYFKTQEIMIYLISLSENLTFISITHHFKESTKLEEIQEIENKKKNLFVKIKQIFEDNQKDSLNEETTFTDKTDHNSESKSFDERLMKNYFENQSEKDYY